MTTPVLVMAGGRGLRLHPLTEHAPKPLVIPPSTTVAPGSKPILETIIERFRDQGFKRIWLSVGYRADLIEAFFGNGDDFGVKIKYIHEDKPLGTGGALNLAPRFEVPFIVCNADVLTDLSYGRLMSAHGSAPRMATICTALHQVQLPFGVVESEDDRMVRHREKPIESFSVNAGIYVLDPKAQELARRWSAATTSSPNDWPFSMPDLIEACMPAVGVYPIRSFWLDVGHFEDLARVQGRA